MLILRCVHLEELPHPLPGAWLRGSCLSCEAPVPWRPPSQAQGDTRRNNNSGGGQLPSPGVSSSSSYRSSQSTGPGCSGGGAADLLSSGPPGGWSILTVLGPPGFCLSPGKHWILGPGALVSGACTVGIALPGPCTPLPTELPPEPLRAAPGSSRTHCSPLGSSAVGCGALSPGAGALLVSQGA